MENYKSTMAHSSRNRATDHLATTSKDPEGHNRVHCSATWLIGRIPRYSLRIHDRYMIYAGSLRRSASHTGYQSQFPTCPTSEHLEELLVPHPVHLSAAEETDQHRLDCCALHLPGVGSHLNCACCF